MVTGSIAFSLDALWGRDALHAVAKAVLQAVIFLAQR